MKQFFTILLMMVFGSTIAQEKPTMHKFYFYTDAVLKSVKKVDVFMITGNDTIKCEIRNDSVQLASSDKDFSLLVKKGKKKYLLGPTNVKDIPDKSDMVFGIVKDFGVLIRVNEQDPYYFVGRTLNIIKLEDIESLKEISFLLFRGSVEKEKGKIEIFNSKPLITETRK